MFMLDRSNGKISEDITYYYFLKRDNEVTNPPIPTDKYLGDIGTRVIYNGKDYIVDDYCVDVGFSSNY